MMIADTERGKRDPNYYLDRQGNKKVNQSQDREQTHVSGWATQRPPRPLLKTLLLLQGGGASD